MKKTNSYTFYPLGDSAIVIQFRDQISEAIHQQVRAVAAYLDEFSFEGFIEYTPAFTSVTIYYQPWVISYPEIHDLLEEMLIQLMDDPPIPPAAVIEIPVVYGGDRGPDLEFVAAHNQLSSSEVIAMHTAATYLVYMIGFAPGFPYLGGMNEKIAAPRKEQPRAKIAAGAVGIAGQQTGIYPIETPGGWQIIGQSPVSLFDLNRKVPALLKAGDRVRFVAISEIEFMKIRRENGN
ncbi:5-oxoprolinase subunit PxpB [Pedobacter sp. PLR]|uniref:5-oxoprolinase subunit PxpB n=1 Tax=Pedobacter sp. PLR TaxID=2994465 RepID=UPI002248497E|nr:5-oxoprolinase subunit PxpB [Pedobacter sp. PLR]MCX2451598.1 5-oxoprolinase subunit PxpB [Pedobacter sp. PLR]